MSYHTKTMEERSRDLKRIISDCQLVFEEPENSENWDKYESKMKLLKTILIKDEGYFECPNSKDLLFSIVETLKNSILTDRTKLSLATQDLVSVLAQGLKGKFQLFIPYIVPALLKILGKNRVIRERGHVTLSNIVVSFPYKEMIFEFLKVLKDSNSNTFVRESCIILIDYFIYVSTKRSIIEFQIPIEKAIGFALSDKDNNIRNITKHTYQLYIARCSIERIKSLNDSIEEDVLNKLEKNPYPKLIRKLNRPIKVFNRDEDIEEKGKRTHEDMDGKLVEAIDQEDKPKYRKLVPQFPIPTYNWVKPKVKSYRTPDKLLKLSSNNSNNQTPTKVNQEDKKTDKGNNQDVTVFGKDSYNKENLIDNDLNTMREEVIVDIEAADKLITQNNKSIEITKTNNNNINGQKEDELNKEKDIQDLTYENRMMNPILKPSNRRMKDEDLTGYFGNKHILPISNCLSCREFVYQIPPPLKSEEILTICHPHRLMAKNLNKLAIEEEFDQMIGIVKHK
ncbi:hypothetical protein K502DRAFT_323256 [Neoconidiobolus thromboides FSU 785]|nr:hypothetical protein K502DRAFT_323256 [Neoconidiobolus thromboides FSU 785]